MPSCDPCPTSPDPEYRWTGKFASFAADVDPGSGLSKSCPNACPGQPRVITVDKNGETIFAQMDQDFDGHPDWCDNCPTVANADQLDGDVDGLGDACDSCPSHANTIPCNAGMACPDAPFSYGQCVHTSANTGVCAYQADDQDKDGIGDACDDCPGTSNGIGCNPALGSAANLPCILASSKGGVLPGMKVRCLDTNRSRYLFDTHQTTHQGVCTNQADADGDGRGDVCDNCPVNGPNWVYPAGAPGLGHGQADQDGDGLGDVCDLCRGQDTVDCSDDSACQGPGLGGHCQGMGVFELQARRVCLGAPDSDGDGRGDACDNCVDVPNPDQANCNAQQETDFITAGADLQRLGDACDPVPCAKMTALAGVHDDTAKTLVPLLFTPNVLPRAPSRGRLGYSQLAGAHPTQVVAQSKYCDQGSKCARGTKAFVSTQGWKTISQSGADAPAGAKVAYDAASGLHFSRAFDPASGAIAGALSPENGYSREKVPPISRYGLSPPSSGRIRSPQRCSPT